MKRSVLVLLACGLLAACEELPTDPSVLNSGLKAPANANSSTGGGQQTGGSGNQASNGNGGSQTDGGNQSTKNASVEIKDNNVVIQVPEGTPVYGLR